jgi:hypothetical protein
MFVSDLEEDLENAWDEIEHLKCCGNCKHPVQGWDMELQCSVQGEVVSANSVCKKWEFDGITER